MHEVKPGWTITKEWEGYTIEAKIAFRDIVESEYDGIFFSGGRAPEYIREDPDLIRITQYFFDNDLPIASVCHGVEIPARADRVKGRRMATVPKCKFDLEICGGTFVDEACVADGNLVSGRTFKDNGHYFGKFIELLADWINFRSTHFRNREEGLPVSRLKTTAIRLGSLKPQSSEILEMGWPVSINNLFASFTHNWESISQGVHLKDSLNLLSRLRRAIRNRSKRMLTFMGSLVH